MKKENIGYLILILLALAAIIGMCLQATIVQNEAYHNFSDQNTFLQIPNFWNVVSNLPFLIVGVLGLFKLGTFTEGKVQYAVFFLGIALVSIGSGYYHWRPNSDSLVWDRLPMTIAFMALFSIIISEFINHKTGTLILIPALLAGALSVLYWVIYKDLRPYALVQFYPLLAIPMILLFFKPSYNLVGGYWLLLLAYIIAKFLEEYDHPIHHALGFISGHSLKHVAAALGIFILLYTYLKRKKRA